MIYHGKLQRLKIGTTSLAFVTHEKSSQLDITFTQTPYAGEARGTKHKQKKKSWKVTTELLLDSPNLLLFFNSMSNGNYMSMAFARYANGSYINEYNGNCFPTRVVWKGIKGNLASFSVELQGTGKLNL